MLRTLFIACIAIISFHAKAQKTPEELGKYVFEYFQQDSISKIDKLVPTLEDMSGLADKIGLNKDSKQFQEAVKGFDSVMAEFHEKIKFIHDASPNNGLDWKKAVFEKVLSKTDSLKLDRNDPNSIIVPVTRLTIYFVCSSKKFRIVIDDAFELNGIWKLGNNIYLN